MKGWNNNMVKASMFAHTACTGDYVGIPYQKLDCQAFVERVLKDSGVRAESGKVYNWKGSNDMWRNALSWKGTYQEAIKKFGAIPLGAWLFTLKDDGGEVKRGYKDGLGNASHVGIFCGDMGNLPSIHSSTGGVQWGAVPATRWTHVGLAKCLDYSDSKKCPLCGAEVKNEG